VETLSNSVNSLSIEGKAAAKDDLNTVKGTVEALTIRVHAVQKGGA
jgi:hypothetical protein